MALLFALGVQVVFASPVLDGLLGSNPEVKLDYGTFKGQAGPDGVDSFLGIPFAKAGRLENPTVIGAADKLEGVQDATSYGLSCPQQQLIASPLNSDNSEIGGLLGAVEQLAFSAMPVENQGEECLTVNVQLPAGINSTEGLPVLFWIHGGGFEFGSSAALGAETTALQGVIYQGAHIVKHSMEMGQPIIFVSANHRLNAFGTLASQEITDAGVPNLLLKDQRTAMQWIQKYIPQFGGDRSRVTLFGESAGSLSIATHLVLNDGDPEGLFSSAIMASGAIMKLKDYHYGQEVFDFIADHAGCGSASDKVDCLRKADYKDLYNAVQQQPTFLSYESTKVPWYPRPDGKYLVDSPHRLLHQGKAAKVPYIVSDMKDEGTLFSLAVLNVTTDEDFQKYFHDVFFPSLSPEEVKAFTDLYSEDPAEGSPYDTGVLNQIGPQYKRISAAIGDYTFQAGRRDLLQHTHSQQKVYTALIEQSIPLLGQVKTLSGLTGLPLLGSFHASDVILNSFGLIPPALSKNSRNLMSTYVAFVNSQDPNNHGLKDLPHWPTWDPEGKAMFNYRESGARIITDDFREKQMSFINDNGDTYRC